MIDFSRHKAHPGIPVLNPDDSPFWDAFLGRTTPESVEFVSRAYRGVLAGKRVLVTGAGGWIGSALTRAIAYAGAREIVLIDTSEMALYEVSEALADIVGATVFTPLLASVCDRAAMADAFLRYTPEIVFHAAALKHVPLMESNPFAVVKDNALGTQILAETAEAYGCRQMVMVSTDKAADPLSLMGASKRIAELMMLTPGGVMVKKAVRLGNVLGSSGSVVPLFLRQIASGGPVTVAHPDVRRYLMTLTEAVDALLSSIAHDCRAGLLVPYLDAPVRILDLAKHLIARSHQQEISIAFTALRPGDKMAESLISARETCTEGPPGALRRVVSPVPEPSVQDAAMQQLQQAVAQRDLPLLIEVIRLLVPEYQASSLIQDQLNEATTVSA